MFLLLSLSLLLLTAGCSNDGVATDPAGVTLEDGPGSQAANDDADTDTDTDDDGVDQNECKFEVPLQASQEVPPTTSSASGRAEVEIEGNEIEFEVRIDNPARESFTAGHIHRAPRGSNGGVVRFLFPNVPQNEEFEAKGFPNGESLKVEGEGSIAPALAAEICAQPQLFYVNFHTTQFPGGAIRGQLR
jgi:hypothetical protein